MNVVAIITARWNSKRLPGKALVDINGKPMLQWIFDRCRMSNVNQVVVATTPSSQPIIDYCQNHGIDFYIGDEEDIVSRLYGAAKQYKADVVIRVWGDSPLVRPDIINNLIQIECNYLYMDNGVKGTGAARLNFGLLEQHHVDLKGEDRHWYHKYLADYTVDDEKSLEKVRALCIP